MAAVARADMASAAIMAAMSLSLSLSSLLMGILAVFGTIAAASALLPSPFFLLILDLFSELPPPPPQVDFFVSALVSFLDVGVGVLLVSSSLMLALALFRAQ